MNSDYHRQGVDRSAYSQAQPNAEFRINLTVAIGDTRALWTAAAARLLAVPGMTLDEVIEVIGPSEDPSPRDCLAALTNPDVLPGCVLDDFWIEAVPASASRSEFLRNAPDRRPSGAERPLRTLAPRPDIAPALRLGLPEGLPSQRQVN